MMKNGQPTCIFHPVPVMFQEWETDSPFIISPRITFDEK
ncbi:hypothetical protein Tco_0847941, partial [Tanacetum coccineum]